MTTVYGLSGTDTISMPITPHTPEERDAARRYLVRMGAEDLIEILGLDEP